MVGKQSPLSQRGRYLFLLPFSCDPLLSGPWHPPSRVFIRKCPSDSLQPLHLWPLEIRFCRSSVCSTLLSESFGRQMSGQFLTPLKYMKLGWLLGFFYLLTSLGFWVGRLLRLLVQGSWEIPKHYIVLSIIYKHKFMLSLGVTRSPAQGITTRPLGRDLPSSVV